MEAKLGNQHSYIWRSILAARSLLEKCTYWRIGNGMDVLIRKDKWIPKIDTHKIESVVKVLNVDARVIELVDPDTMH